MPASATNDPQHQQIGDSAPSVSGGQPSSKLHAAVQGLWTADWKSQETKRALRCLPAVALPLIAGLIWHNPVDGLLGAAGAFAVGFGSFQTLYQSRIAVLIGASAGIALSGFVGVLAGHTDAGLLLLATVWAFATGLLMAIGPGASYIGTQCTVFLLVASAFPVGLHAALTLAGLVFGGGILQTLIITAIRALFGALPVKSRSHAHFSAARGARLAQHTLRRVLIRRSAAFWHAIRLALVVGVAAAGSRLIHNHHNYWMPVTAVIVMRPELSETFTRGLSRVVGTLIGAGCATLIAALLRPSHLTLVILVVIFAWLTYSVLKVNYAAAAICITSYIVFLLSLAGLPEAAVVTTRIGYTAMGAFLALLAYSYRAIPFRRGSKKATQAVPS